MEDVRNSSRISKQIRDYLTNSGADTSHLGIYVYLKSELQDKISEENNTITKFMCDDFEEHIMCMSTGGRSLVIADFEPDKHDWPSPWEVYIIAPEVQEGTSELCVSQQDLVGIREFIQPKINTSTDAVIEESLSDTDTDTSTDAVIEERENRIQATPSVSSILRDVDNYLSQKDPQNLIKSLAHNLPFIRQYIEESKTLEATLSKSHVDTIVLQNRIHSLEETVESKESKIEELRKAIDELKEAKAQNDLAEVERLQKEIDDKESEIKALNKSMEAEKQKILTESQSKQTELEEQNSSLLEKISSLKEERDKQLAEMKHQFDAEISRYSTTISELQEKVKEGEQSNATVRELQDKLSNMVSREEYESIMAERDMLDNQLQQTTASQDSGTNFFSDAASHSEVVAKLLEKIKTLQDPYAFSPERLPFISGQTEGLPQSIKIFKETTPSKYTIDFISSIKFEIQSSKSNTFVLIFDPLHSEFSKYQYESQGLNKFNELINFIYIATNTDINSIIKKINFHHYKNLIIIDRSGIAKDVADLDYARYYFLVDDPDVMKTLGLLTANSVVFYDVPQPQNYAAVFIPDTKEETFMSRVAAFRRQIKGTSSALSQLLDFRQGGL